MLHPKATLTVPFSIQGVKGIQSFPSFPFYLACSAKQSG